MAQSRRPRRRKTDNTPAPGPSPEQERFRLWEGRVRRAKKLRKDWEDRFQVKLCGEYFLGKQLEAGDDQGRVMNHFYATIKVIKPNLIFQHPKFYVRAKPGKEATSTHNAAIGEGVLESVGSQDDNLKKAANLAVDQSFYRVGVLKVCYDPAVVNNDRKGQPIYGEDGKAQRNPMTGEEMTEPDSVVSDEVYRYEWVDSRYMLFPDEGPDMSRWTWIGEEITVPLEEAKSDTRFPADKRRQLEPNVTHADRQEQLKIRGEPESEADQKLRYIELYDVTHRERKIYAEGQPFEGFLLEDDTPNGIEDHPYAVLAFNEVIEPEPSPWPMPLVYPWLDVQAEYNVKRRQVTEGGKRAARKVAYFEGSFEDADEAQKALQSPLDMEAVKVNSPEFVPVVMDVPPINSDIYRDIQLLQHDWQVITGQTGARLGGAGGETATENIFIERAANLRDAELQGRVQQWLATAGRKMWQLVRQTMTLSLWINLRGYDDQEFQRYVQENFGTMAAAMMQQLPGVRELWKEQFGKHRPLEVHPDDLAFEADISVVPGSQRPQTLESERRSFMEFLGLIGQFPMLALSRGLLGVIGAKFDPPIPTGVLDELHGLAKVMVGVNANQAGRNQGPNSGTQNGGGANGNAGRDANPLVGMNPLMQAMSQGGV